MRILILLMISVSSLFLASCNSTNEKTGQEKITNVEVPDTVKRAYLPVTDLIKGQLTELSSQPISPLRTITSLGKTDSTWIKNVEIAKYAVPFLQPEIDSAFIASYYSERSFLDQTLNAFTFTYEPKKQLPDSFVLENWNVYVNPETNEVQRIYLVKKLNQNGRFGKQQLTWKSGEYFKITSIVEQAGKEPIIEEEKVTWKF